MVTIYEVRYPDSRRGAHGESPYSTALFVLRGNADAFADHLKGATVRPLNITYREFLNYRHSNRFEQSRSAVDIDRTVRLNSKTREGKVEGKDAK